MKCKFCREEIPEGAKVCPLCGSVVSNEEWPAKQETPVWNDGKKNEQQDGPEGQDLQGEWQSSSYHYKEAGQTTDYINQNPINGTMYIVLSVLATLLCCLPFGIIGIVFSSRINFQQKNGNYESARESAKMAKIFLILSLVLGIIVGCASLGFLALYSVGDGLSDNVSKYYDDVVGEYPDDAQTAPEDGEDGMDGELDDAAEYVRPAKQVSKLGDGWDTYTVQINDKVIALPCEYKDLKAAGLSIDDGLGLDNNGMVSARGYLIGYLADENGNSMTVEFINSDKVKKKAEECLIGSITVGDYDLKAGGLTVTFPGGVQIGASEEEVAEKYGEPEELYEGESLHIYTWSDSEMYISTVEADFDPESKKLVQMTMKNYEGKN